MDKKSFIIFLLFIIAFVAIVLTSHRMYRGENKATTSYTEEERFFLNHQCEDLKCIASNFLSCTAAEYVKSGKRVAIYGFRNDKCQVKTNRYNCYLNQSDLTIPMLNQLLGNDEGLESMVLQYCQ